MHEQPASSGSGSRPARRFLTAAWRILVALVLLGAGAVAAQAQGFGKNKVQYRTFEWKIISSPHFDIYYYEGGDSLAIRALDLCEKANIKLTRDLGHILTKKIPIILYVSHNDFAQTNVTLDFLDEGTGGFTELLKNRVVLPFPGSYEEFRHVLVHELVHAFMFDMIYSGGLPSFITRQNIVDVPLWFAEGLAEWVSLGWEPNADMFLRDGTIGGYLPPIQYNGGYLVYKQGQAAMKFLTERYGPERIRDLLQKTKYYRSFYRAFEVTLGTSVEKFDQDFQAWCKRMYWPSVAKRGSPEEFARRLTDHRRDRSNLNMAAAVTPLGDRVAYISDKSNYTDIYVLSSLDGRVLKRVIRGDSNRQFESVPSFRSSLSWSSDGKRLAFVAESQSRDVIYVVDVENEGKILREHRFDFDAVAYPTFSAVDERIVFAGVRDGRSDLYIVDVVGNLTRLTDDSWDEKEPTWSPDGKHVAFASDRSHPLILTAMRPPGGYGEYAIFELELASKTVKKLVDTSGDDSNPAYAPDGKSLAFVSDRGGSRNAYLFDPEESKILQLTDLIGGIYSTSWSRDNDRVVFSAFNEGGWDIFVAKEPLSLSVVRKQLAERHPAAVLSLEDAMKPVALAEPAPVDSTRGALAPVWPDTLSSRVPESFEIGGNPRPDGSPQVDTTTVREWGDIGVPGQPSYTERARANQDSVAMADSMRVARAGIDVRDANAPFLLPDSILSQEPTPYKRKFSTEFAAGQLGFNSSFGLAGSTVISVSDFLGNHRFMITTDIFAGSLDETNILAYYYYLPKRWDYGLGVFHYKSYYYSSVTSLGESFSAARQFADRNVGFSGTLSYPFDRFRRIDFDLTNVVVDRSFYAPDIFGNLYRTGSELRTVTAPSVTYVKDTGLYGYYGPVSGGRYYLYASRAVPLFPKGLDYLTLAADWRKYWPLGADYQFAMRARAIRSSGPDQQVFEVGGYSTIRGFPDFSLRGSNVVFTNLELRFPFINALGVVGPLPIGFFNLRGAVFTDIGAVWTRDEAFRLTNVGPDGNRQAQDLLGSVGVGARSSLGFMLLRLDVAWPNYLDHWGGPRWHFSLSPQF
ncbi:MAG: BamA/TamA family outer membrane protein [Candidatus Eiseniibacteriota bacterium]